MRIYDITQPLTNDTVVWPGDPPVRLTFASEQAKGDMVTMGRIEMGLHNGTHVDAPFHYRPDGARIEAYGLSPFVGICAVIAVPTPPLAIQASTLKEAWKAAGFGEGAHERILIRTRCSKGVGWTDDYAYLTPEAVRWLGDLGCRLVGIDTPTYDPKDSTTLDAHHALAEAGIANLENLVLDDVPEGVYTLAALPLAIVGMEAAPVRAVLIAGQLC